MPYPKSQIQSNLYTRGDQFTLNGEPYTGPYFRLSSNRVFSGRDSNDPSSRELTVSSPQSPVLSEVEAASTSEWVIQDPSYTVYTTSSEAGLPPQMVSPHPTSDDIERGSFVRYFVKSVNSNLYYETNKGDYNKLTSQSSSIQYSLYIPIRLNWRITGDRTEVYNSNIETIRLTSERNMLPGFGAFFKGNFIKYFVDEPSI